MCILTCYFKGVGSWKEGSILSCGLFTEVRFPSGMPNGILAPLRRTKQQQYPLIGSVVIAEGSLGLWDVPCALLTVWSKETSIVLG